MSEQQEKTVQPESLEVEYRKVKDEFIKTLWLLEKTSKSLKTALAAVKAFRTEIVDPIIKEGESVLFETEKAFKVQDTFKEEQNVQ